MKKKMLVFVMMISFFTLNAIPTNPPEPMEREWSTPGGECGHNTGSCSDPFKDNAY